MIGRRINSSTVILMPLIIVLFFTMQPRSWGETIDNIGLGHFPVQAFSPLSLLRPSLFLAQMPVRPKGTWTTGLEASWGNFWNYHEGIYTIDGEFVRVAPRLSYAFLDQCEIGLSLPITGRMGGWADEVIEDFHKCFNFPNAGRDQFPRNRLLIEVINRSGEPDIIDKDSWGLNDLPVFLSFLLTRGTGFWPAVSGQLMVTIPVGDENELEGLGTPIFEVGTMLAKRLGSGPFVLYLGGSVSYCSKDEILGLPLQKTIFNGLTTLEYQCNDNLSLLAQYLISSPWIKNYYELSDPVNELNFGFKWLVADSFLLELSIMEDLFNFQNGTDIGIHLGLTKYW